MHHNSFCLFWPHAFLSPADQDHQGSNFWLFQHCSPTQFDTANSDFAPKNMLDLQDGFSHHCRMLRAVGGGCERQGEPLDKQWGGSTRD